MRDGNEVGPWRRTGRLLAGWRSVPLGPVPDLAAAPDLAHRQDGQGLGEVLVLGEDEDMEIVLRCKACEAVTWMDDGGEA